MKVSGPGHAASSRASARRSTSCSICGIATETARFVASIAGTKAKLIDTRKTTPGLRMLEKHAVICGGGANHRLGLDGGVMIKDNHIAICGSITAAVARARGEHPGA